MSGPPVPGAAVAVVLVRRADERLLVVRKRELQGYPWSGQVAFPGGRIDETDPDSLAAALRELEEETAIPAHEVLHLGCLGVFPTLRSTLHVAAHLFRWTGVSAARPLERELDALWEEPLAALLAHHTAAGYEGAPWGAQGPDLAYPADGGRIWGLSARILHTLLELTRTPTRS